jgi:radical SAM protein with 4Fe4S-binding SPASM domain
VTGVRRTRLPLILWLRRKLNRALIRTELRIRPDIAFAKPRHAIFEMTSKCQLRCPLCSTGGLSSQVPAVERGVMAFDTFAFGIDRLSPELEEVLLYNWGEPLLNPELFRCIAYASERKVHTTISTNAMAYREDMAEKMVTSGLGRIIVSCDGLSQATYEKYRAGGRFDKVVAVVRHLVAARKWLDSDGPHIQMQFIVFRHNQHEMEEFRRFWMAEGVDSINFIRMSYMSRKGKEEAERLDMVPTDPAWAPHHPYGTLRSCNDPYEHITIDWNGDLYTCCFPSGDRRFKRGNIRDGSIRLLYNSAGWRYSRRLLRKQEVVGRAEKTMCHDCTGVFPAEGEWPSYWHAGGDLATREAER